MENNDVQPPEVPLPPKVNGAPDLVELAKKALTPPPIPAVGAETPSATAPSKKIDEADRLAIENIYLQMQNLQQRLQIIEYQKNETAMAMKDLQVMMETKRAELSKKYGVDLGPKSIDRNGNILSTKA
jgi:hypothetical protein